MIASFLESFERFSANGGSAAPQSIRALRLSGITRFETLGFPTTRNEDWHFTSVAPIAEGKFLPLTRQTGTVTAAQIAPFGFDPTWHTLVFVNGRYNASLSGGVPLPRGVRVLPLAKAFTELSSLVEQHLGKIASYDAHTFTALNTAFIDDGAVVHVANDLEVATPIHLLFVSDASAVHGSAQPRNLVVLGSNAKATVIESYAGTDDGAYFTNTVTEASIGAGATLTHLKLQRESRNAYHVGTVDARQARDSHFFAFSLVNVPPLTICAQSASYSRCEPSTQWMWSGWQSAAIFVTQRTRWRFRLRGWELIFMATDPDHYGSPTLPGD